MIESREELGLAYETGKTGATRHTLASFVSRIIHRVGDFIVAAQFCSTRQGRTICGVSGGQPLCATNTPGSSGAVFGP